MRRPRGPVRWLDRLGLSRPDPEESVAWEIEHHIAEAADRLVEAGLDPEDARREAERKFGDPRRYSRPMRRMERGRMVMEWRTQLWDVLAQSIVSVARTAHRSPGFTLAVVLTLGLGIGANATMYGVVDRMLLQPPQHIVDHERVVRVFGARPDPVTQELEVSSSMAYPDFADLREHSGMESVAAFRWSQELTIGRGSSATRARVVLATAEFFPLLGVTPSLGRFYSDEEAGLGQPLTAVLGHEYWTSRYGAEPGVLGRSIEVAGQRHTIVGVAPPGFTGVDLRRVDVWLPLEATHGAQNGEDHCLERRNCWWMAAIARLAPGVDIAAAEAEATRLHLNGRRELIEADSYSDRAEIVLGSVIAAQGPEAPDEANVASWLAGVSLIVLLIACANVANLLLARATRQRREIGVRLALGAARRRLVGRMVTEALLLAGLGAALALCVAQWGGQVVRSTLLPGVFFPGSAFNGRLVAFTAIAAVVAGLFAGVVPAIQGSRAAINGGLDDGVRGNAAARSSLRGFLTVTQAALSVVLLVGAGLFVRSLHEVRSLDLGLDIDQLLLVELEFTDPALDADERTRLYEAAARSVAALPGVAAAAATAVPFQWQYTMRLVVEGLDSIPRLAGGGPYYYPVTPSYFETVGLGIVRGRGIDVADGPEAAKVAVVSETMASALWPDGDPVGRCLMVGSDSDGCTTIVGVIEDAARGSYQDDPFMAYYLPSAQRDFEHRGLYVRTVGNARGTAAEVAALTGSLSPDVRYAHARRLGEILDPQARAWTLGATMFSVFGLLALTLAAIGLYSVLAFDVAQRTRELGIRTALGAKKERLLRSVVVRGARLGVLGVALGLGAAYLAAPYAREMLFEVSPRDPVVLVSVALVLVLVSAAASFVPGLRATRVDPMDALRAE